MSCKGEIDMVIVVALLMSSPASTSAMHVSISRRAAHALIWQAVGLYYVHRHSEALGLLCS